MTSQDTKKRRLILASASPRRASLLTEHGYQFEVIVPPVEEPTNLSPDLSPADLAQALSYFKARSVAETHTDSLILAADTIAAKDGQVFGKPTDVDDARRILGEITGTTHDVITGVTLLDYANGERQIDHVVTSVTMRSLTDRELQDYLDSNAWEGKAGAYGIQDHGDRFVTELAGSFTNVVGLPMELVNQWLFRQ